MVGKVITDDERAAILKRCRWPEDHNHPSVAMHLRHLIGLKVINQRSHSAFYVAFHVRILNIHEITIEITGTCIT